MAYDAFLEIEGVDGEATREGFEDQIIIDSFNLGAHNTSAVSAGGAGAGAGKASLTTFNIGKKTDKSSPKLFQACCTGKHFPSAKVTLLKAGGEQTTFLEYEFDKIFIEDIQWNGMAGGEEIPAEVINMAYGVIKVRYTSQNEDGTPGEPMEGGWDIVNAQPPK
jgi:type VI secretion system Hcp family effector